MNKMKKLMIKSFEYSTRRSNLSEKLAKLARNNLVILKSADIQYKTYHIPRFYHQNTYFNYLTGFQEKNSALILMNEENSLNSILFIDEPSQEDILWNGKYPSKSYASEVSGIENILSINELGKYVKSIIKEKSDIVVWSTKQKCLDTIDSSLLNNLKYENICPQIDQLRLIKSDNEIKIMTEAGKMTREVMESTIKFTGATGSLNEHQILGKFMFETYQRGGRSAYPPVIAGGNRANTVHYLHGTETINNDDLILMDAGCDVLQYYADVTRTWPRDRHFNEHQAILYDILHRVFLDCVAVCTADRSLDDLYIYMMRQMQKYLIEEHIMKKFCGSVCPHHIGHFLGLDIHDSPSVSTGSLLQPGTVFTLEPGLYFPSEGPLDVRPEFRGIGARLEDDFFMPEHGHQPVCLNEGLARSRTDLETLMNTADDGSLARSDKTNVQL